MIPKDKLREILSSLPKNPGVYRYYDRENTLVYVGKAKNLKNRVSSYFHSDHQLNGKTKRLVSHISHIEYTIVDTEFDALLLENSLIKENQPRYNIRLKDDKSFPYIVITKEKFPRLISTRGIDKSLGQYFGPYINVKAMNVVLDLLRKTYTIRTCSLNLSEANIKAKKFKICLEHHIGNCLGPCESLQTEENYLEGISQARNVLKGEINGAKSYFKDKLKTHVAKLEFEKAALVKERLDRLEQFQTKTVITSTKFLDLDVFTITTSDTKCFVNFMKVQQGSISATQNFEVKRSLGEADFDVLMHVILRIRQEVESRAPEVLVNIEISIEPSNFLISTPQRGDKRKLVELSIKNALKFKQERTIQTDKTSSNRILDTLQKDLKLANLPTHIECFDNSNIQGSHPVASMVCFKMGKPSKKDYRHFNIKTVIGPNDFDSMTEIVTRRYSRLKREKQPFPQLVIIDGGKGQLSAAIKALKDVGVYQDVTVVGIAKRLEEIYFPGDNDPLLISKKSESLKLIQQLRNEAHRFAITFHRDKRSQDFLTSSIEQIPGIGKKTYEQLIAKFKSLKKIKSVSKPELEEVVGKSKADLIHEHLTKHKE